MKLYRIPQRIFTKARKYAISLRGIYWCLFIRLCGGQCEYPIYVDKNFTLKYPPHEGWSIGKNVVIGKNVTFDVPMGAELLIGSQVKFNMDIVVACSKSIRIGDYSQIAEFVSIRDTNHGVYLGEYIFKQQLESEPVTIGNDVWIGRGVAVLKGACINDGAVIGANALVRGEIPPNVIAVGMPAKAIKKREFKC